MGMLSTPINSTSVAFIIFCAFALVACGSGKNADETSSDLPIELGGGANSSGGQNPTEPAAPDPIPGTTNTDCTLTEQEQALVDAHNVARAQPRRCDNQSFAAAAPLTWNCKLVQAAREHSQDMAANNFMSHYGSDGLSPFDRMTNVGYRYATASENVAAGQRNVAAVIDAWLKSPGHCKNIMNPNVTEIGASAATNNNSDFGIYWTAKFGKPR